MPLLADEAAVARQVVADADRAGRPAAAARRSVDRGDLDQRPDRVFVARDGVSQRLALALDEREVRDLVERMLQSTGRRVDLSSPFVDASLPDGSRLHVVIPDITRAHWAVNIRKFRSGMRGLERPGAARFADAAGRRLPRPVRAHRPQHPGVGGDAERQDDAAGRAARVGAARRADRHRRGDVRARARRARLGRAAMPSAQPRGDGRGLAATTHQRGAADAAGSPDRRRGARGGGARPAHRAEQRPAGHVLAARQQRARCARRSWRPCPCSPGATSTRRSSCRRSRRRSISSCTPSSSAAGTGAWSRSSRRPARSWMARIEATTLFELRDGVLRRDRCDARAHRQVLADVGARRRGHGGAVTVVAGLVLGAGLVLVAAPWLWPRVGAGRTSRRLRHGARAARSGRARAGPVSVFVGVSAAARRSPRRRWSSRVVPVGGAGARGRRGRSSRCPPSPSAVAHAGVAELLRGAWPDLVDHLVAGVRAGQSLRRRGGVARRGRARRDP